MIALLTNLLLKVPTFMGLDLINVTGLTEMLSRFALSIVVVWIITHFFYYPKSKRRDYYFTFMLISVSIFMLIYLMDGSKMKIGAALGLFAVFGILRYRTESVPIREMTYLFFLVALSVVNGMAAKLSFVELIVANAIFVISVAICESNLLTKHVSCKYVKYDNIKLIVPEKREELMEDLSKRLGVKVLNIEVGSVNFLRDTALIKVFYEPKGINTTDSITRLPKNYE